MQVCFPIVSPLAKAARGRDARKVVDQQQRTVQGVAVYRRAGSLGCIDFGEVLVGPAAWEFAAMGYFMDWATADAVLGAYLPTGVAPERMRADASAISLCFGVYRWAQDRDMELDQDEFDEGYLEATLARL